MGDFGLGLSLIGTPESRINQVELSEVSFCGLSGANHKDIFFGGSPDGIIDFAPTGGSVYCDTITDLDGEATNRPTYADDICTSCNTPTVKSC